MWKGMEYCARKQCQKLCTFLFAATCVFWKMCWVSHIWVMYIHKGELRKKGNIVKAHFIFYLRMHPCLNWTCQLSRVAGSWCMIGILRNLFARLQLFSWVPIPSRNGGGGNNIKSALLTHQPIFEFAANILTWHSANHISISMSPAWINLFLPEIENGKYLYWEPNTYQCDMLAKTR